MPIYGLKPRSWVIGVIPFGIQQLSTDRQEDVGDLYNKITEGDRRER